MMNAQTAAQVVNPDVIAKQRRRNDPHRQYALVQEEGWTKEKLQDLYEWVGQRHLDLEGQICHLQHKHNQLALNIFELEECYYGANQTRARRQSKPLEELPELPALKSLKRKWRKVDNELRLLRHMQRILGPLYYLSCIHSMELPTSDPFIMLCWEMAIAERPWLERRGKTA